MYFREENEGGSVRGWIRTAAAACMTGAVSGLVKIYGLEEAVFFNKSAISLAVFFLGFFLVPKAFDHWKKDRRIFLAGYGLAAALAFTEFLGGAMRLEVTKGDVRVTAAKVLFMAGAAFILAFALEPLFYRIMDMEWKGGNRREDPGADRKGKAFFSFPRYRPDRIFLGAWGFLFLSWLPCALAFYPGLYCYDMSWQWAQFDSGVYNTHHPLIHTVLCGGIIELGKVLGGSYERGLFFHSLIQLLFLAGSMAFGVRFLAKRKVTSGAAVVLAFFALFPYFPVLGISTTKDTMFAGFFFVVFVCICDMVWDGAFYRGKKLAAFGACAVAMCLFRNNGVYGLAVMACCLAAVWVKGVLLKRGTEKKGRFLRKAIGLILLIILISQGAAAALEQLLDAQKGSRAEMLSLPMQQMARAYVYHREEFTEEDKEALLRFFEEESLLRYKYYVSDPVKAGMNMEEFSMGDFVRLWLRLARKFPGEYQKAPLYNMMGLWYLGGDSSCYVSYEMLLPFDQAHKVEERSRIPWLKACYSWFTDENLQRYLPGICLFFYTSFYSWCVFGSVFVLAAKRKYRCLILPLFLGSYECTLALGPCIIVRYFLGIMMCVPLLAVMTFGGPLPPEDDRITFPEDTAGLQKLRKQ